MFSVLPLLFFFFILNDCLNVVHKVKNKSPTSQSLTLAQTHARTHTHSVIHSYMNLFTFFNDCHKYPPHDPTYPIISIHLVKTNTPILTHTLAHSAVQNSSYSLLCCLTKIINNPTFASTYQYTNVHTSMYVCM